MNLAKKIACYNVPDSYFNTVSSNENPGGYCIKSKGVDAAAISKVKFNHSQKPLE